MSDLPDEVMKKARWEADNACIDANLERERDGRGYLTPAEIVAVALDAAAPILIEAERERIKARIEAQAGKHDKWAEIDEKASRTSEDDYFKSESFSMRAAHHRIRAETLRAALSVIDKEGGTVGSGNQEEQ